MDALENLMTRRSIRAFTEEAVPQEALERIVGAARYAPSGMNKQLWRFTVVQNPAMLDALAAVIREEAGRDPAYHFHGANVLILASNERDNPHGVEDCACALENMFLAAHALGIGSVWINQFKGICDRPRVRGLLTRLHLPDTHIVLGCAALGYAARPAPPALKKRNVVEWVL